MSQLILTRGSQLRKGTRKSILPIRLKFNPNMLIASLVVFVCLISLVTLMHATKEVTKGFVLTSLEVERVDLLRNYEVRTMQIAEVSSLHAIQNTPKFQSMVRPRNVVYIHTESALAKR